MNVFEYHSAIKRRQIEIIYQVPKNLGQDLEKTFSTFSVILNSKVKDEFKKLNKSTALRVQVRAQIKLDKFSFEQDRVILVEQWFPSDSAMIIDKTKIAST